MIMDSPPRLTASHDEPAQAFLQAGRLIMLEQRGTRMNAPSEAWPVFPSDSWGGTFHSLHMWTQIVGKTRLALAPMENHWWQVALYPTARGLTTSAMPGAGQTLQISFDFVAHKLL